MPTTVYLAADHAGFTLKESIREHLEARDFFVDDLGAHTLDANDDYPMYAGLVAEAVREHPGASGILVCGSAEGVCMAANKFDGIRAALGFSVAAAEAARKDEDANVLCVPGRLKTVDDPLAIVDAFLATAPSNEERHRRRREEIKAIEENE